MCVCVLVFPSRWKWGLRPGEAAELGEVPVCGYARPKKRRDLWMGEEACARSRARGSSAGWVMDLFWKDFGWLSEAFL